MVPADWLLLFVAEKPDAAIDPVRVQKGLFLLAQTELLERDERYVFEPYSYGPMSRAIYRDARELERAQLVERVDVPGSDWPRLRATAAGRDRAERLHRGIDRQLAGALAGARETVDRRSFSELLEYVYDRYPHYATRSVFRRRR